MKIEVNTGYRKEASELTRYVESNLSGDNYDGGAVEDAARTAEKATEGVARLCEVLAKKGTLTADEVIYIATGYTHDEGKFIDA